MAQGLLRCVTTRDLALAEALNQVLGLFSNFDRVKVDLGELELCILPQAVFHFFPRKAFVQRMKAINQLKKHDACSPHVRFL